MLPIIQSIIPSGNKCRPGTLAEKKFIVIHETGNKSPGAGAANHAAYLQNLARANTTWLSWHFTVDDKSIYQHIPTNEVSWNAGDGANGPGNVNGISMEICVNPESDFGTALHNAAQLTAYLLREYGLGIGAVKQHYDFNGKDCPKDMRAMGLWPIFLADIEKELKGQSAAAPAPGQWVPSAGDIVLVNGSGYSTKNATGGRTKNFVNTPMKVLQYNAGALAPFLLTQIITSQTPTGHFPTSMVSPMVSQAQPPVPQPAQPQTPAAPPTKKYVVNAAVSVNVRQTPGGKVIDWYMRGRQVDVIGFEGEWGKIVYGSGVAYIFANFLTKV